MNTVITIEKPDVEELWELFDAVCLGPGLFPPEKILHMPLRSREKEFIAISNSMCVTARVNKELVGFLRVITDKVYSFLITNVVVHPDFRHNGIASKMIKFTLNEVIPDSFIKVFLFALPGTEEFYEKFGFKEAISQTLCIRGIQKNTN